MASYERETIAAVWDEVQPLLMAHWREIAHYPDIVLAPDRAFYDNAERMGALRVFTARLDGALIGYVAYFVKTNVHYRDSLQATQDVLFIHADHRRSRFGLELIRFADGMLAADGVQVVHQHVKCAHNFGPLLERLGYEHVEHIYSKRLDRAGE